MKKRLDILVTEQGLAPSREKAKALIMEGIVYADGVREDKPGTVIAEEAKIEVRGKTLPYVSRGGLKLEKAQQTFALSLEGKCCLDIGASTGGFTDCMLQNGAVKVYAIDVGYGQLAWKLRSDPRVVCLEKTNIRLVRPENLPEKADFASIDVSFISLSLVLGPVKELLKENGRIVCLIKPQFEAGREKVGKHGVVRDPAVHEEVILRVLSEAEKLGLHPLGLTYSPVKGPEGNIEYLLYLEKESREEKAGTETGTETETETETETGTETETETETETGTETETETEIKTGTAEAAENGGDGTPKYGISDRQVRQTVQDAHGELDR